MERVEHRGLDVGKERRAQEEVGVPQRQMAAAQRGHPLGPIRGEIGEGVHTGQHAVRQSQWPERCQRRNGQAGPRQQIAQGHCPEKEQRMGKTANPSLWPVCDRATIFGGCSRGRGVRWQTSFSRNKEPIRACPRLFASHGQLLPPVGTIW